MQYLRISDDGFGFLDDRVHLILESDIQITSEEYEKFFEMQSAGKSFRLKEKTNSSSSLFDLIETFEQKQIKKELTIGDLKSELNMLQEKLLELEQKIKTYEEE